MVPMKNNATNGINKFSVVNDYTDVETILGIKTLMLFAQFSIVLICSIWLP